MSNIIRSAVGSMASVGLLKFFKESNINVIGTDIVENCVGRYFCDGFEIVPKANLINEVTARYISLINKYNSNWIVSGPEEEILALSQNQELSSSLFHPKIKVLETITDKWKLYQFLANKGIDLPYSSLDTLEDKCNKYIGKPRLGRGSAGLKLYDKNLVPDSIVPGYIYQEFIKGKEFSVDTLHDYEGELRNVVVRERISTSSGISTIGRTLKNNVLTEIILEISNLLEFRGVNCFQFLERSGHYYLIDINPRFGGGSILSIKASESFRMNIISMINKRFEDLLPLDTNYEQLTMLRGYEEVYTSDHF